MTSDCELLRRFSETNSEDAFAELVRRHLDLVFSAALRQVNGDAHLAQDVAQTVFTDLARKAAPLSRREVLTGWLYISTHFAAAKAVRTEGRRRAREQEAHTMRELLHDPASDVDWDKLHSVLDEAMHQLKDSDREAILLRYFERRPLAEVGAKFGVNENSARMRVERALEKLRAQLVRRGVTTTAAALSTAITVNAVQIAPAGLAVTLASASLATAAAGTASTLTILKFMATTKFKASIISAIVVSSIVTPLMVQHQTQARLRDQDETLRQRADQLAKLQETNLQLSKLLTQAKNSPIFSDDRLSKLLKLRGEVGRLRKELQDLSQSKNGTSASGKDVLASTEKLWAERVNQFKQWSEANPSEKIPELRFLNDRGWLDSIYPLTLATADEYSRAMSNVRANAECGIIDRLYGAFRRYAGDNNGQPATDISQLKSYLDSPIDELILQRYEILVATNLVSKLQGAGDWVITQKGPVNEDLDTRFANGLNGGRLADVRVTNRWVLIH